jgi:hypothetical protein
MSGAWVAGTTRARTLAKRRIGLLAVRELAGAGSLSAAVQRLAATPYGHDVRAGQDLATAQRAVAAALLWHLRVLAGWLPAAGRQTLRILARWFELANTDELLHEMGGGRPAEPFTLGALATAWPALRGARSPEELRQRLAVSAWGDPGGAAPREIQLGMRVSWAAGVAAAVDPAAPWAAGGLALLVARERCLCDRELPAALRPPAAQLVGARALAATSLAELAAVLPAVGHWALDGVDEPSDLWRAEARWWSRLDRDGFALLAGSGFGVDTVLGAVALLAADAWRVRAALEIAAHGGRSAEAFDVLAG